MDPATIIAILVLVAYGPSILFTIIIARAKRYRREPGSAIVKAFLWGATGAAAIALVVNTVTQGAFVRPALRDEAAVTVVVAVLVAPFVEEAVKPLVLYMGAVRRNCDELVDGLIYGAVAGLGFAATENLLYESSAYLESGTQGFITTAIARTLSATLLHAVASAIVGYGIAVHLNRRWGGLLLIPIFLSAVMLHAAYNAFVIVAPGILIIPLFAIAIWGFFFVRRRIHNMSLVAPSNHWIVVGGGEAHTQPPGQGHSSGPGVENPRPPEPPQQWRPVSSTSSSPSTSTYPPRPPDRTTEPASKSPATEPSSSPSEPPTWSSDAPWARPAREKPTQRAEQEPWEPIEPGDDAQDDDAQDDDEPGTKPPRKRRPGPGP